MNTSYLLTLMAAMACSIATAHPYLRWDNPATRTLNTETELMRGPDSQEKNLRIAVGDNPDNAVYWNGEKPLPAARLADLLQLSMAAGSTKAEDWFTNKAGDVLVFIARPGVGARHHVFTVFSRKGEEWHKTGTYHFISRHLQICWEEVALGNGLTIVATSPNKSLRMEKRFDFADARDTFCAYEAPEEAQDMGLDLPVAAPTPHHADEWAPRFLHYSSDGYPRYANAATQALEADVALMQRALCPEQGRRAFAAFNPDNAACWDGTKALPATRVADLLQLSLSRGYTVNDDWFTNASGSILVFVAQPGNGAVSDIFTVFRKSGSAYHRVGVYTVTRRALNLCRNEIMLTDESLTLTYTTRNNNTRLIKQFSFRTPRDTVHAFEDAAEMNDCGKDSRPNRYIGLPELAASPARERLQPQNEITRLLRRAEQEFFYKPDSTSTGETCRDATPLTLQYLNMLRHGDVVDWICDPKSNTIACISRSTVPHEVITTYTFRVYRIHSQSEQVGWKLLGTYKLHFSPYSLRWCPEETYFLPHGLHVRCTDGARHTGVIFHYNESTANVQLN
ncbi:MAG: hypothetical protein IJN29_10345 [Akkermansia sp.]|nr:hypothetical protein [Akkermansia sp.]